jgi:hypothetical protein
MMTSITASPSSMGLDSPNGATVACVAHIAFTYRSLEALIATYTRLKAVGILPWRAINHGPTVSLALLS